MFPRTLPSLLLICLGLAAFAGCSEAESKSSGDKADEGKHAKSSKKDKDSDAPSSATAKAAEAASGCPAGAYTDKEGGYCLVVPADWKPGAAEPRGTRFQRDFKNSSYEGVSISTYQPGAEKYENRVAWVESMGKPPKGIELGNVPNGKYYVAKMGDTIMQAEVVINTAKGPVECYINTREEKFPAALAACKSLRAL